MLAALLVCGVWWGGTLSAAVAGSNEQSEARAQSHGEDTQTGQQHRDVRSNDSRMAEQRQSDARAEERRAQEQTRSEGMRHNARLTPDERRDLRRQINEAGQDIYANPPRR